MQSMSEHRQPFTEYATKANRGPAGARPAWIVAGITAVLLIVVLLLWSSSVKRLRALAPLPAKLEGATASLDQTTAKLNQTSARLNQTGASLASALAANQQATNRIAALETQVAELEKEKERVKQAAKGLEEEMRTGLESRDVTISKLQGKLTVHILDRVMFDSGEAIMKPDGEAVLRKIAAILEGHPELKIQVIGHTDNVPIRNRFPSNWELSTSRALDAVHFLTEQAGVDPRRVGAVGYGEYRPLADNSTAEGRARNRRIAVTILPDELAGADAAPGPP